MSKLSYILKELDKAVWGPWMLTLFLGTGIYLMVLLRFLPIRRLKAALALAFSKESRQGEKPEAEKQSQSETGISAFQSLMTELASTIGTGNIVGVATAMILGGPGALFWMLISSIFGMASKLTESMLSVKYRQRNEKGELAGGPMYVLQNVFPYKKTGLILGKLFAISAVFASIGMGNMTQANSIAAAFKTVFQYPTYATGLAVTIFTILAVLGGISSISKVTLYMVPFMGILYLAGTVAVILTHIENVFDSIINILGMAFIPQAFSGGIAGTLTVSFSQALRYGVSRGVFSNEAGLGAGGISAAAANTYSPVRQAYISMTGVFMDTAVICTLTGLALSASGVLGIVDDEGILITGTALCIASFQTTFGEAGAYFVCICISLFAFATIVGWAYQGEKAFEFLFKRTRYCIWYRFIYALSVYIGAVCSLDLVWNFSDICNGLMAVPNLICVWVLSKRACEEIRQYPI